MTRLRVLLASAVLVVVAAPIAGASEFMDLPGMGPAKKATGGGQVPESAAVDGAGAEEAQPSIQQQVVDSTTGSGQADAITDLPGAGALPVIKGIKTSTRLPSASADLIALAALGSLVAVSGFWALRRRGLI